MLLYTASTLYHGVTGRVLKARLRVLDHSAIYLLIAGSYTPFLLLRLRGPLGWSLFGLVWLVAIAGVVYKLTLLDRFPRFSTASYLAMAWLALIAVGPLFDRLGRTTLAWIVAGGVIYTTGCLIFHLDRNPPRPLRLAPVRPGRQSVPFRGDRRPVGPGPAVRHA